MIKIFQRRIPPDSTTQQRVVDVPLEARGLVQRLNGRTVLTGVDLTVYQRQIVLLTGANGSGKSTLLRCLAGRRRPTAGEVVWFGAPPRHGPASLRCVGLLAHDRQIYLELTARENLRFAARMHDLADSRRHVDTLLATSGLASWADRPAGQLSSGLRQRLAIARALVHDPPIVLLDEPWTGLDIEGGQWLDQWLRELRSRDRAICLTAPNPALCPALADRVFELRDGKLSESPAAPNFIRVARQAA